MATSLKSAAATVAQAVERDGGIAPPTPLLTCGNEVSELVRLLGLHEAEVLRLQYLDLVGVRELLAVHVTPPVDEWRITSWRRGRSSLRSAPDSGRASDGRTRATPWSRLRRAPPPGARPPVRRTQTGRPRVACRGSARGDARADATPRSPPPPRATRPPDAATRRTGTIRHPGQRRGAASAACDRFAAMLRRHTHTR